MNKVLRSFITAVLAVVSVAYVMSSASAFAAMTCEESSQVSSSVLDQITPMTPENQKGTPYTCPCAANQGNPPGTGTCEASTINDCGRMCALATPPAAGCQGCCAAAGGSARRQQSCCAGCGLNYDETTGACA